MTVIQARDAEAAPAAGTEPPEERPEHPGRPAAASGFRRVLAAVLAFALLVSLAAAVWLAAGRRGEARDVQDQREQVMAQTRQFLLRMGTYGPDLLDGQGTMPAYRERVGEVITPKLKASFDEEAGVAEQLVAKQQVAREAAVFATGVSDVDPDSATALVAGTFTDTYQVKGAAVPAEPVPFRIEVSLVKVEGEWLVDDFTPVTGPDEQTDPAGGLP